MINNRKTLNRFTDKKSIHDWQKHPFALGNNLCATNSHSLILLPKSGSITYNELEPDIAQKVSNIIPEDECIKFYISHQELIKLCKFLKNDAIVKLGNCSMQMRYLRKISKVANDFPENRIFISKPKRMKVVKFVIANIVTIIQMPTTETECITELKIHKNQNN